MGRQRRDLLKPEHAWVHWIIATLDSLQHVAEGEVRERETQN